MTTPRDLRSTAVDSLAGSVQGFVTAHEDGLHTVRHVHPYRLGAC
jgi:hypothetical protein